MARSRRSFREWQAARAANKRWASKVKDALGPLQRTRPRDRDEARLLREAGTPERLIGPTAPNAPTDHQD